MIGRLMCIGLLLCGAKCVAQTATTTPEFQHNLAVMMHHTPAENAEWCAWARTHLRELPDYCTAQRKEK